MNGSSLSVVDCDLMGWNTDGATSSTIDSDLRLELRRCRLAAVVVIGVVGRKRLQLCCVNRNAGGVTGDSKGHGDCLFKC